MNPAQLSTIRIYWSRLRIYRRAGSVVIDYKILRNKIHQLMRAAR